MEQQQYGEQQTDGGNRASDYTSQHGAPSMFLAVGSDGSADDLSVFSAELRAGTFRGSRIALRNPHDHVIARQNFCPGTTVFGVNLFNPDLGFLRCLENPL